jgi:hypothetical protein
MIAVLVRTEILQTTPQSGDSSGLFKEGEDPGEG